jgi:hypothetical protein
MLYSSSNGLLNGDVGPHNRDSIDLVDVTRTKCFIEDVNLRTAFSADPMLWTHHNSYPSWVDISKRPKGKSAFTSNCIAIGPQERLVKLVIDAKRESKDSVETLSALLNPTCIQELVEIRRTDSSLNEISWANESVLGGGERHQAIVSTRRTTHGRNSNEKR